MNNNNNNDDMYNFLLILFVVILNPFFDFIYGYFIGWLIKITISEYVIAGLSLININIPLDKIPLFFATLLLISSFFKTTNINKNKK